ncbi:MAG: polyprenyl synthetase family protein [Candidatus Glassbacteria bacterium]|nr:polyprenyl synthetase family protein [Candidatus Glassbacteria bacterium]
MNPETSVSRKWVEALAQIQLVHGEDLGLIGARIEQLLESDFEPINEVMGHLFSKSGKMIRPTLLLMAADRERVEPDVLVSLGASVELIHTASLVHDDTIDSSSYRRGVETLNSKWNHKTSVIIGDYLLARAFSEIASLGSLEVVRKLTGACRSLASGEMRQMTLEGNLAACEEDYFKFVREKTGSLFAATCAVAAITSGGKYLDELESFGMLFGCIFQITDDLLDYPWFSLKSGKPTGLDMRERKITLPLIHSLSRIDGNQRAEFERAFTTGGRLDDSEASALQEIVIECGGLDYAWGRAVELAGEAADLVEHLDLERASRLKVLVDLIVERDR